MALSWVFNPFTNKLDAVDGVGASASNSFETINCPAGTDPVADSATDTLNLTTSDSKITITGTAGTDTIDFTAPTLAISGATSSDNSVARYDGTNNKTLQSSVVTISDSGDIVTGSVTIADAVTSNFNNAPGVLVDSGDPSGSSVFGTNDLASDATTSDVNLTSGRNTSLTTSGKKSGDVFVSSGYVDSGAGTSGRIFIFSGATDSGASGLLQIRSNESNSGNSGTITLESGNVVGAGADSGGVFIETGDATGSGASDSGPINLVTGISQNGTRGSIRINGLQTNIGPSTGLFLKHDHADPFFWGDSGPAVMADSSVANNNSAVIFGSTDLSTDDKTHDVGIQSGMNSSATTGGVKTGRLYLQTGIITDSGSGDTGQIFMETGEVFDGNSGLVRMRSGSSSGGSGNSGSVTLQSGSAGSGNSGALILGSGPSNAGISGVLDFSTGAITSGSGGSGSIDIYSGDADDGTSGHMFLSTGQSVSGNSGAIDLASGDVGAAQTSGNMTFQTGFADNGGISGNVSILTGNSTNSGFTGGITIQTGDTDSGGFSGSIQLVSGPADLDSERGAIVLSSPTIAFKNDPAGFYSNNIYERDVTTTNNTMTDILSLGTDDDSVYLVKAKIIGAQTAGAGGSVVDTGVYEATAVYRNIGATLTEIVAPTFITYFESDAAWDVDIDASGTNIRVRVQGNTNDTIKWAAHIEIFVIGIA